MFFFEDKRPDEVKREELALSDFNIEDHDYMDNSIFSLLYGRPYARWLFHYALSLVLYFIIGGFIFPAFFLFIIIDFTYYLNDDLVNEETLSFEFYWILYDLMIQENGADFNLNLCTFYIYNELGYVLWGVNLIDDYCDTLFDYNFVKNQIGLSDHYVKLPKINMKKKKKINNYLIEVDRIENLKDIKNKDNFLYTIKNIKSYLYFNKKIMLLLKNNNIVRLNKINNNSYYYLFNKSKGLSWYKFNELFK